jgi:hypothetical protein
MNAKQIIDNINQYYDQKENNESFGNSNYRNYQKNHLLK